MCALLVATPVDSRSLALRDSASACTSLVSTPVNSSSPALRSCSCSAPATLLWSLLLLLLRVSSEVAAALSIVFPTFKSSKKATSRFCSCSCESIVFRSSPSKRVQCFSYTKSSECCKGKPEAPSVVHLESHASHTSSTYVISAAILGFAGIAAFLHYNDERRAVPKGIYDSSCGSILFQESHEDGMWKYTTISSLSCSSISHDGSLVAGGFSDSSLKVFSGLSFFDLPREEFKCALVAGKAWATDCQLLLPLFSISISSERERSKEKLRYFKTHCCCDLSPSVI